MLYAADMWFEPVRKKEGHKRMSRSVDFMGKMSSIQRTMEIGITGAMQMIPNDLLNVHANLYPVTMLANEVCFRAAMRYITLDETHPLHKPVKKVHRYVKRHRSPLHKLLNAFNLDPTKVEKILTTKQGHHKREDATIRIDIVKEKDREDRNMYKVYTNESDHDGEVGASVVLYRNGERTDTLRYYLGESRHHVVFKAEIVEIILGLQLLQRVNRIQLENTTVMVDSQAAIKAVFKGHSNSAYHRIFKAINDSLAKLQKMHKDLSLLLCWTLGHVNIDGSKAADEEVKRAAPGDGN